MFPLRGMFGRGIEGVAKNHISGLRLQQKFKLQQASSIFDDAGYLTEETIQKSVPLPIGQLKNPKLIRELSVRPGNMSDWAKYTTESIQSPSGNFQMHFYRNSVTGDVYYGIDYKAIFDHQGLWSLGPKPNFNYEPSRLNP